MIRKVKNKNGTTKYEARIVVAGKPVFQRFETRRDAEAWQNHIRFHRDNGKPMFRGKVTVDDLFNAYRSFAENKGRAPATLIRHDQNFRLHIKPFFEDHDIRHVSIEEHEKFLAYLKQNKKLSSASVNRVRSLLVVLFNTAIKKGFFGGSIVQNPFDRVERLLETKHTVEYWSAKEIGDFLNSQKNSFYYPMWVTWLNTGLRVGELVSLDRAQVDTGAHILSVDRTYCGKTKRIKILPKGKKVRHVGLNGSIQEVLYPTLKTGLVFSKEDGEPLTQGFLYHYLLPKTCNQAGVKEISPHQIRHTYGAHYMMNGGNLWDLQKILGHSDIKTTEEYYAHFSREHVLRRANVISFGNNLIEVDFKRGVVV